MPTHPTLLQYSLPHTHFHSFSQISTISAIHTLVWGPFYATGTFHPTSQHHVLVSYPDQPTLPPSPPTNRHRTISSLWHVFRPLHHAIHVLTASLVTRTTTSHIFLHKFACGIDVSFHLSLTQGILRQTSLWYFHVFRSPSWTTQYQWNLRVFHTSLVIWVSLFAHTWKRRPLKILCHPTFDQIWSKFDQFD